jgi:YD repeat-containing protein
MRTNAIVSLMFLLTLMCMVGCQDSGQPTAVKTPSGEFAYTDYDLDGNVVVSGTMILHRQGNQITGERDLKGTNNVTDSGPIGGTINPDGSFVAVFDPTKDLHAYVSIVGSEWPTIKSISGDVIAFSGTASWAVKEGTFKLSPIE